MTNTDNDDQKQQDLFGTPPVPPTKPSLKRPSCTERRLIERSLDIAENDPDSILYQHTVFCQTAMPYRDPGPAVRDWEREQGAISLLIEAGRAKDPTTGKWAKLGLPFGPKPRLILCYLNAEALRTGSPEIEVEDSLTAFVKRLGLHSKGQNMRIIKDQLARLSAAQVRLSLRYAETRQRQVQAHIISGFDLWFPKNEQQRTLWPSTVCLSLDYFNSLQRHAVPLDERALTALSHSATAIDVYAWLTQRLHRVQPEKPQFIPWTALKDQFGWNYGRMIDFKRVFRHTLAMVHALYLGARFDLDDRGLTLRHSPPPIRGRYLLIPNKSPEH